MSGFYTIVVSAWPFSTGKGRDGEYRVAGPERREFTVKAAMSPDPKRDLGD